MGVSNRAARAIDPATGDLLIPERNRSRKLQATQARDIEDACFEAVSTPRDVFSRRFGASSTSNVFKTRIMHPELNGAVPRDFAARSMGKAERLDVFTGQNSPVATGRSYSAGMMAAVAVSGVAAVLAFWAAGGRAMVNQSAKAQLEMRIDAPAASASPVAIVADPVVTSSIPAENTGRSANSFSAPLPRPARIERAGSILMIRPAGD